VAGCCECGNETSSSMDLREFLDWLRNYTKTMCWVVGVREGGRVGSKSRGHDARKVAVYHRSSNTCDAARLPSDSPTCTANWQHSVYTVPGC